MTWHLIILATAFLACGCKSKGKSEFELCDASYCVNSSAESSTLTVLCHADCAPGLACLSKHGDAHYGTCVILCASDSDCRNTYFHNQPPTCDTTLDVSDVSPKGWCEDNPVVTQSSDGSTD